MWLYLFIAIFSLISLVCLVFAIFAWDLFFLGMAMIALTITLLALFESAWWKSLQAYWEENE